ncbi:MAG: bifunctional 3,4-dihydroxy-2-butanone-4-phosphate synthase/GTP cyclohydrolase II [Candidatus Woesearchaeota archaeon]|nr:bifunctional 3,4-dihydroxy-2-butanone-4-phosphate synthase/GTP cyclohydrolase II [Candidatus Woesearchaeota archaeon]
MFHTVEEAITAVSEGEIVIVVDDEDRENEGDFIMAAEKITPGAVNFIVTHGRGLLCAPITEARAKELHLAPMVDQNTEAHRTKFTVSVDHKPTNTTGISATDRANTILALTYEETQPGDLARPGHVFPLIAKTGGVLRRAGHTEAAVDLARLAGLQPAGVICEIMNEDGTMARTEQLFALAKKHNLKIITIQDLIRYRRTRETFVEEEDVVNLPTKYGEFKLHMFTNKHDPTEHHMALVMGNITDGKPVLVRMHSECLTGDVFGSERCDCGEQLSTAMAMVAKEGRGVIGYLRQEGRGIGLPAKIKAYALQEQGLDTVEANEHLGYKADLRDYGFGAQMLRSLGVRKLRLLTNNPKKIVGLEGYNLEIVERVSLAVASKAKKYLRTKKEKMGHLLP